MSTTAERKGKTNKHFISGRHAKANSDLEYMLVSLHRERSSKSQIHQVSDPYRYIPFKNNERDSTRAHLHFTYASWDKHNSAANVVDSSLSSTAAQWLSRRHSSRGSIHFPASDTLFLSLVQLIHLFTEQHIFRKTPCETFSWNKGNWDLVLSFQKLITHTR